MQKKPSPFSRHLWLMMGISGVLLLAFAAYAWSEKQIERVHGQQHLSFLLTEELRQSSDDLTRMARTYVVTGDLRYKKYYQSILDIRDGREPRPLANPVHDEDFVILGRTRPGVGGGLRIPLLSLMHQAGFDEAELRLLTQAKAHSDALTSTEFAAMALIEANGIQDADRSAAARQMLHDRAYHQAKASVMQPIRTIETLMEKRTADAMQMAEQQASILRIVFAALTGALLFALWRIHRALNATLGGSLDEVCAHIAHMGQGDFSSTIAVPPAHEHSVLGWLARTQANLRQLDQERQQAEKELRDNEKLFRAIAETSPLAIYMSTGVEQTGRYVNQTFTRLFGYTMQEISSVAEWWPRAYPDVHYRQGIMDEWQRRVAHVVQTHGTIEPMDVVVTCKDGSRKNISWGLVSVGDQNWAFGLDLTARIQAEEQVRQLAFHDPLTLLPNRRLLNDRLGLAMAASKRSGYPGALIFLDLDHFKPLNDTHGHDVGDLLLVDAAGRIQRCVRDMDTVARFGGDEFVVMISELGADPARSSAQARLIAEKIRASLAQPYRLTLHREALPDTTVEHRCTASIGVILFTHKDSNPEKVITRADIAMYQAKNAGGNQVYVDEAQPPEATASPAAR
jgi:diguanylate cyclase (GGDEF)-like protein/PAS domain S-box-containing protein